MSLDLIRAAKLANEQITAIHKAFGAPGDWGYDTPKGDALFDLYRAQVALRDAIHNSNDE